MIDSKTSKKIGIIFDISTESGLGHYSRMMCLSNDLLKINYEPIFILPLNTKKILEKLKINIRVIFYNDKIRPISTIGNVAKKNKISSIVIDSYKINHDWERELKKCGLFIISIDDHLKKHSSDIIFSNKPNRERKYADSENQLWYMGPEYSIVSGLKRKIKKNKKIKKILLHAGGSGLFNLIEDFTVCALKLVNNYDVNLTIICPNKISQNMIKKLIKENNVLKKIIIIPFINNLSSKMKNYDVIAGPSGTSTFETILAGSFPFTVQLQDDNRDSLSSWHNIGHLMHLSFKDKKNISIINSSWEMIFRDKERLSQILNHHSKQIDGKGSQRIAKIISDHILSKISKTNYKNVKYNKNKIESYQCTFHDMSDFLKLRNQKHVRQVSTVPSHIITWPEHLTWWLKNKIRKFVIEFDEKIIGYHWIKLNSDKNGNFITSGWFLKNKITNKLKMANHILKFQSDAVNKYYKDVNWIIIMKNNNLFVEKMNRDVGFKSAKKLSITRAVETFKIRPNEYKIMEMKI